MNLNKGCIEMQKSLQILHLLIPMNLNKGCIEIKIRESLKAN